MIRPDTTAKPRIARPLAVACVVFTLALGCDAYQGYLLGRPMPVLNFENTLHTSAIATLPHG